MGSRSRSRSAKRTAGQKLVEEQTTQHVLMISPNGFTSNEETKVDNKFMDGGEVSGDVTEIAMKEWASLVEALRQCGVIVHSFEGQKLPDEVFPNNWFSTHSDGRFVIYPMKVASRAQEVRQDVISKAKLELGLDRPVVDFTEWRASGLALEGTGSLVLDRPNRVAYMALSQRADRKVAEAWSQKMGYELIAFDTRDRSGAEIYHTNVLMSVGEKFAVFCPEVVPSEADAQRISDRLKSTGKTLVSISLHQMEHFAGNCLEVRGNAGSVLAMSSAAWNALDASQQSSLEGCVGRVLHVPVPTIERIGGGSVRCMLGELFPFVKM